MRVQPQRGGFVMGLIVGLLVGLGVALAVALWVTKVPVPFINKVPQRPSDSADAERNRNWDPNSQIGGKGAAARPGAGNASAPVSTPPGTALPPYVPPVPPPVGAVPGASTAGAAPRAGAVAPAPRGQASAPATAAPVTTPIAAPAAAPKPGTAGSDPFSYFVQAGAYTKPEDAEQQRARLAIMGYAAKVTEREQVGKTMYRVRLGPFEKKDSAEAAQAKLQEAGVDAALVRVERSPTATAGR
jgi:cell division protein FtsN